MHKLLKMIPTTPDMVSLWLPSGQNRAMDIIRGNDGQCFGTHPNVPVGPNLIDTSFGWHFDGVNDYVDCGNDGSLNFGTVDFTVGAWIKYPVALPAVWDIVVASKNLGSINGWKIELRGSLDGPNAGKFEFRLTEGAGMDRVFSILAYNDNIWHFVVGVRDYGNTVKLYVDSGIPASIIDNSRDVSNADNLFISDDAGATLWKGYIALPFIAKSAWSVAQINNFYLATKGIFAPRG